MLEKKIIHQEGYQVTVVSWENDADNYNTTVYSTTNKNQAEAMYQLALLFKNDRIGNLYDPNDFEKNYIYSVFAEFAKNYPTLFMYEGEIEIPENDEIAGYWVRETAYDLGLTSGEYYTRRCERVTLTYSPVPIEVIVLEDSN